jgi:hypothetical protein
MVRSARRALSAASFILLLFVASHAGAQSLPRLHVDALGLRADKTVALVGEVVHVTIHIHVREQVDRFENFMLPDFGALEIVGDERHFTNAPSGTDYIEQLTVVGLEPGDTRLTPARLDAIDANNGRAMRFSSNSLLIHVVATRPTPASLWLRWGRIVFFAALGIAVFIALAVLATLAIALAARRSGPAAAPPPPVTLPRIIDPRAEVRASLERLRGAPTRAGSFDLRGALRALAGADRDETLAEILARLDGSQTALRGALRLAERAAFSDEGRLQAGIEELMSAVEALLR